MDDRPVLQDQIEVSEEMIEAGLVAYQNWVEEFEPAKRMLTQVFVAMLSVSERKSSADAHAKP